MALEKEDLLAFLRDEMGLNPAEIADETPLFSSGMIDSFSLVSLITFIEQREQFRMSPMDVNLDNMDSIARILGFVERVKATT